MPLFFHCFSNGSSVNQVFTYWGHVDGGKEVFTPQHQRGCIFPQQEAAFTQVETKHCWSCYSTHIGSVRKVYPQSPSLLVHLWNQYLSTSFTVASIIYSIQQLSSPPMQAHLASPGIFEEPLRNSPYLQCLLTSATFIHWCQYIFWKHVFTVMVTCSESFNASVPTGVISSEIPLLVTGRIASKWNLSLTSFGLSEALQCFTLFCDLKLLSFILPYLPTPHPRPIWNCYFPGSWKYLFQIFLTLSSMFLFL